MARAGSNFSSVSLCFTIHVFAAAAKHGHRAVLDRLLGRTAAEGGAVLPASPPPGRVDVGALLEGAARGMPLAVLQQLHTEHSVRAAERRAAGGGAEGNGAAAGGDGAGAAAAANADGGAGGGAVVRMPLLSTREQVKIVEAAAASPAVLAASISAPSAVAAAYVAASSAADEEPGDAAGSAERTGAAAEVPLVAWVASASAAVSAPHVSVPLTDDGDEYATAAQQQSATADRPAGGIADPHSAAVEAAREDAMEAEAAADDVAGSAAAEPSPAVAPSPVPTTEVALTLPAEAEPAWRAKLKWLESQQYPKPAEAWSAVAALSPPPCGSSSNSSNSHGGGSCRHFLPRSAGCCLARVSCQGAYAVAASSNCTSGSTSGSGSSSLGQGGDWRERFEYLRSAGYPLNAPEAVRRAASAGHEAALQYLLATQEGRWLVRGMRGAQPRRSDGGAARPPNGGEEAGWEDEDVGWLGLGPGNGEEDEDDNGPGHRGAAASRAGALHAVSRAARAAARGGHIGVLRVLAAHGLDLQQVPLLLPAAVRKRQLECAAWLLEHVFGLPSPSASSSGSSPGDTNTGKYTGRGGINCAMGSARGAASVGDIEAGKLVMDASAAVEACLESTSAKPRTSPVPQSGTALTTAAVVPSRNQPLPPGLLTRTLLLSAAGSGCPRMVAFVHERLRVGGISTSTSTSTSISASELASGSADVADGPGCGVSPPAASGAASSGPGSEAGGSQSGDVSAGPAGAGHTEPPPPQSEPAQPPVWPHVQSHGEGNGAAGSADAADKAGAAPGGPLAAPNVQAQSVSAPGGAAGEGGVPAGVPEALASAAATGHTAAVEAAEVVAPSPEADTEGHKEPQPTWDEASFGAGVCAAACCPVLSYVHDAGRCFSYIPGSGRPCICHCQFRRTLSCTQAAWAAAAKAGCVQVLELLASYGCPMGVSLGST